MMHEIFEVTDIGLEELLECLVRKYSTIVACLAIARVHNRVRSSSELLPAFRLYLLSFELQSSQISESVFFVADLDDLLSHLLRR